MKYELSFIINTAVPETEHKQVLEAILKYLKEAKASQVSDPYFLGRRKLAYPIKKQKHGFYAFLEFETDEKSGLLELENKLKLDKNLVRHLIIKKDKIYEQKTMDPARFEKKAVPAQANSSRKSSSRARTAPAPAKAVKTTEKSAEKKVSLDDIDKKLDEILKDPKVD